MTDELILQQLKNGDETTARTIYWEYKKQFIPSITQRFNCSPHEAEEYFQLAFAIFYDNIIQGKIKVITGTLRAYFFKIGENKIKEIRRKKLRMTDAIHSFFYDHVQDTTDDQQRQDKERDLNFVEEAITRLGDKCQEILRLFYYNGLRFRVIADQLDYENEETVRKKKYKCMKQLERIFTEIRQHD